MSIGAGRIPVRCVAGAIPWAVVASNRRTSSFVTYGSNARVPGGTRSTAIRCWRFAVRSTMGHWIRWLCGLNSGSETCKNYLMLPPPHDGSQQQSCDERVRSLRRQRRIRGGITCMGLYDKLSEIEETAKKKRLE